MTPQYKATKRYQERHRRLGLCVSCSRKAKTGMLQCRVCLARMRNRWMARHPKFCPECGKLIKPDLVASRMPEGTVGSFSTGTTPSTIRAPLRRIPSVLSVACPSLRLCRNINKPKEMVVGDPTNATGVEISPLGGLSLEDGFHNCPISNDQH